MKKISPVWMLVLVLLVLFLYITPDPASQSVAPSCFEKADCAVPIQEGYCGVDYGCVQGKCYSEQALCPELCYGNLDEDMDGKIDCDDEDCFNSPSCPCGSMSFGNCRPERCYCEQGKAPYWVVTETKDNICWCN